MIVDRRLFVEVVIMLAVCLGGWLLIVEPKATELAELEAGIREAKSNPVLQNRAAIEEMASRLQGVRGRVREIAIQNSFGRDSSEMYGLITGLAETHGVTMHRLDPGTRAAADEKTPVQTARFNMRVEGQYHRVAAFLEAVEGIDGFVRPVSLSLVPRGQEGSEVVEAQFACEAVSFNIPDALAQMMGENDAHE